MGGEDGGGVAETTVDVKEMIKATSALLQADVSDSRAEAPVLIDRVFPDGDDQGHKDAIAPHFDSEEAVDHVMDVYLRSQDYFSERRVLHRDGRGGSGFYKVPSEVRQQAGRAEAVLLYDPKYVNFRKISDLLLQQEQDRSAQRQLSHYRYHLYGYADGGRRERIKSLIQQLEDYKNSEDIKARDLDPAERQLLWVDPPLSMVPQSLGLLFAVGFVGDLFQRSNFLFPSLEDPQCAHSWAPDLWSDLLLLENQIPLFRISYPDLSHLRILFREMYFYFNDFIPLNRSKLFNVKTRALKIVDRDRYRYLHVLHFVHEMLLPNALDDDYTIGGRLRRLLWGPRLIQYRAWMVQKVPTVTMLVSAGVRIKPVDMLGFVVEFKKGVLKLPRLHVSQSMKKMLANLIAWEMCHEAAPKYISNYAIFMNRLIKTTKDVEILIESKVFEHSLATDDEVKTFFYGLGQGLAYTKPEKDDHMRYDIFPMLTEDTYKYCKSRRNKWMANLMQEYFRSPWSIISFIAALFLILLTTIQTFYAVYPYARPH